MIKLLLLAIVPFMTEHRNVTPKTEVSTNFYGSVTGIVDNAYIQAHGGGGVDTNAVRDIILDEITPATNRLNQTLSDAIDDKRDKDDLAVYEKVGVGEWMFSVTPSLRDGERIEAYFQDYEWVIQPFDADGNNIGSTRVNGKETDFEITSTTLTLIRADGIEDVSVSATRAYKLDTVSPADSIAKVSQLDGKLDTSGGNITGTIYLKNGARIYTDDGGINVNNSYGISVYGGGKININGDGSIKFDNPASLIVGSSGGLDTYLDSLAWRTTGNRTLSDYGITNAAPLSMISETNQTFSNAVLAVGLNIDTNSVAVLNEIASTFGGFPIEGTATTVGGLLAALAAAIAWLKKNKVGSFASVGGASATVDNSVAKLDDFFTESNSLLTGTIDAEVISKGTAPDAHLEAPTDERLKLVLADSSVAYDSAKALPYKLTSAIGDRVIATMTLTAASTDITLPTIAANDTTVKDFILDVTNAYAVEGVATDAAINIPRTDCKLVTRDGESLTDVTTVKAGKSAFICFTQKSPVVVDGTTYPCWCVIQLPFGDPS